MKHRTLRCAAETLVLLLIAVMAVFLAAGLHQRAPDGALSTLSTGWYQLTDGGNACCGAENGRAVSGR